MSKRAASIADRKRELAPVISQFLFLDDAATTEERIKYLSQKVEIRELIKTKFNREVLSEILLDLQKDVAGEARDNLYDLYKGLGLHYDAYAKLRSWRWEVVSQGILELTQMNVDESYMFIRRFVNHRKGVVRKQAQIATVSLKNEGIGYFLDTCRYRISEWQQLKLLDVLRNFEDFNPPRFRIWLTSKNRDVVLFALRLIRYYNQNDANLAIIQLLKHRNSPIKAEAIQCLKEFGVTEAINTLKSTFRKSGIEEKIAILDTLAVLGSHEDIEFLKKVERRDDNFTVRSKAISAINTLDPESIVPSEGIQEPSAADIRFAEDTEIMPSESDELAPLPEDDEDLTAEEELRLEVTDELPLEENPVKEDQSNEEPLEMPELLEENEFIFDMCMMEEIEDILDEANQEEEPVYLPLNFLPIVQEEIQQESEHDIDVPIENMADKEMNEEQKFKKDLDTILNNIAMKDKRSKPKKKEEKIPDFLPIVVDSEVSQDELSEEAYASELEVISESVSDELPAEQDSILEEEYKQHQESIKETPVVAETIPYEDMAPGHSQQESEWLEVEEEEEDPVEELLGFSIFHEMFRDFDVESKLILLDEILVVGEEKELCFLGTLANDPDKRIRAKASKIKSKLAEKLKQQRQEEEVILTPTTHTGVEFFDDEEQGEYADDEEQFVHDEEVIDESEAGGENEKLPLEFCLYEGAINELLESNDIDPYFEMDSEIIEPQEEDEEESREEKAENTEESKRSIFNSLFSLKPRERKDG